MDAGSANLSTLKNVVFRVPLKTDLVITAQRGNRVADSAPDSRFAVAAKGFSIADLAAFVRVGSFSDSFRTS